MSAAPITTRYAKDISAVSHCNSLRSSVRPLTFADGPRSILKTNQYPLSGHQYQPQQYFQSIPRSSVGTVALDAMRALLKDSRLSKVLTLSALAQRCNEAVTATVRYHCCCPRNRIFSCMASFVLCERFTHAPVYLHVIVSIN